MEIIKPVIGKLILMSILIGAPKDKLQPSRALYYSLIFPGAGQFYTGHPVKGAFYLSSSLFIGYNLVRSYRESGGNSSSPAYSRAVGNAISLLALWGLSILDAYVSAHLYGFDREFHRVMDVELRPGGVSIGMKIIN